MNNLNNDALLGAGGWAPKNDEQFQQGCIDPAHLLLNRQLPHGAGTGTRTRPDRRSMPQVQYRVGYKPPLVPNQLVELLNTTTVQQQPQYWLLQQPQYPQPIPYQHIAEQRPPDPTEQHPVRSQSWAEIADLPFQRTTAGPTARRVFSPPPMGEMRLPNRPRMYNGTPTARQALTVPDATPPPVFRMDMRQETPPDFMDIDDLPPPMSSEERMASWLQLPRAAGERTGLRLSTNALPTTPSTMLSPARSVAGQSDRSSRRSRKERQNWSSDHKCNVCGEGFYIAEYLK